MNNLILVRHGQSLWNKEKRFTGWADIDLTDQGKLEAELAGKLIKDLNKNNGKTSIDFRKRMAKKSFEKSADYDQKIAKWFDKKNKRKIKEKLLNTKLRYGENPHQKGFFKHNTRKNIFNNINSNKQLSYNNFIDADSALSLLQEFKEPTSVIIKHNNPCGVGSAKSINLSFNKYLKRLFVSLALLNPAYCLIVHILPLYML